MEAIKFQNVNVPSFGDSNAMLDLAFRQGDMAFKRLNDAIASASKSVQNANTAEALNYINSLTPDQLSNRQAVYDHVMNNIATGGMIDQSALASAIDLRPNTLLDRESTKLDLMSKGHSHAKDVYNHARTVRENDAKEYAFIINNLTGNPASQDILDKYTDSTKPQFNDPYFRAMTNFQMSEEAKAEAIRKFKQAIEEKKTSALLINAGANKTNSETNAKSVDNRFTVDMGELALKAKGQNIKEQEEAKELMNKSLEQKAESFNKTTGLNIDKSFFNPENGQISPSKFVALLGQMVADSNKAINDGGKITDQKGNEITFNEWLATPDGRALVKDHNGEWFNNDSPILTVLHNQKGLSELEKKELFTRTVSQVKPNTFGTVGEAEKFIAKEIIQIRNGRKIKILDDTKHNINKVLNYLSSEGIDINAFALDFGDVLDKNGVMLYLPDNMREAFKLKKAKAPKHFTEKEIEAMGDID